MTGRELATRLLEHPDLEVQLEVDDAGTVYHIDIERVYLDSSEEYVVLSQLPSDEDLND